MRVMQIMAGSEFGGAEAFFVRLVSGLAKAGLDQRILIRTNERRAGALRLAGIEPQELVFGGRLDFKTPIAIRWALREYRPQVVMTWMNRATRMMPRRKLKDVNYVHVARLGGYYDLKYYRNCDHLIGNTLDIVDYLIKEGWPEERAHYLPNFVAADVRPAVAKTELHIPPSGKMVFAMGRLHENKAFDVLIRAMEQLPQTYLCIAGEGPEHEKLEELATRIGVRPRIRFVGWREDTAALLAAADVFVCPSRHEPLGNVVIEAWAQSRPVIATASQGPSELIQDGKNGLLVPIDDHQVMAEAIKAVLGDDKLAKTLGAGGRRAYEAAYTETEVVNRYLDFIKQVAD